MNPFEDAEVVDPFADASVIEAQDPFQDAEVASGYTESGLVQFLPQIRDYMSIMTGAVADDTSDEEIINQYLNRMRGFSSGNTVRAGVELARLAQLNDEEKVRVGEAYTIFEGMDGIFSENATWGETLSGVGDYTRSMLLDPINLVGFGVGKAVSSGGTKVASKVAQKEAMRIFRQELAKGATREAAEKAAVPVFQKAFETTIAKETAQLAARDTARSAAKGLQRITANKGLQEIAATVGFDATVAVGTELAYQSGLVRTGAQEDYSWANAGLAALGVMALGGATVAVRGMSGRSGNRVVEKVTPSPATVKPVLSRLGKTIQREGWMDKIARGKELKDLDTDFWAKMVLGDSKNGIKGLAEIMADEGFFWQKSGADDKISNWMADVISQADPQDAKRFLKDFESATGVKIGELTDASIKEFADNFAMKMRQGGITLNAASQAAKILGRESVEDITLEDYAEAMLGMGIRKAHPNRLESLAKLSGEKGMQLQNNTIRMLVSNLATSTLNVKGWAFATTVNSVSDIAMATLYGGQGLFRKAIRDEKGAKEAIRVAGELAGATKQKLLNLLDPNATADSFRSLALARPEAMRELVHVLPGGVEDLTKLKKVGFDMNKSIAGRAADDVVDGVQYINFVTAQDVLTKSQEYMYQIDKGLRIAFGKSFRELSADKAEFSKLLGSKQYREVELKAIYETQRAIFSKSFKGKGIVGEVAGVIEDARTIPGIGLLVPFGRFFNNTIATMADATGVSFFAKYAGFNKERSKMDLLTRMSIGWGLALSMADDEFRLKEEGYAWYEKPDDSGTAIDYRYDFPYSMFKAAARLMSYSLNGEMVPEEEKLQMLDMVNAWSRLEAFILNGNQEEIPPELVRQMGADVFGQLTRQLTETTGGMGDLIVGVLTGESGWADVGAMLAKTPIQFANSWTRFMEPVNVAIGMAKTDFKVMDRKQGNVLLNESIRYIDQLVMLASGEEAFPEQRYDAASGQMSLDAAKFGGRRTQGAVTNTERLLNTIGVPPYKLNGYTPDPKADNRYNQLFLSMVEEEAGKVWGSPKFQDGTLEQRKSITSALFKKARDKVLAVMKTDVSRSGDRQLAKSFELGVAYKGKIDKALETLGLDVDYTDLTYEQLQLLESFLKTRDEILKIQTK